MDRHLTDEERNDHAEGMTSAAADEHLVACANCTQRVEDTRRLLARLRSLPGDIPPPSDLWPGIAARLDDRSRATWLRVAAALLIFVGGAAAGYLIPRKPLPLHAVTITQRDVAGDIQREGAEYVAALSALPTARDERVRLRGREVALSTLYGALYELQRTGSEEVSAAMRTVADRRDAASRRAESATLVRF